MLYKPNITYCSMKNWWMAKSEFVIVRVCALLGMIWRERKMHLKLCAAFNKLFLLSVSSHYLIKTKLIWQSLETLDHL